MKQKQEVQNKILKETVLVLIEYSIHFTHNICIYLLTGNFSLLKTNS